MRYIKYFFTIIIFIIGFTTNIKSQQDDIATVKSKIATMLDNMYSALVSRDIETVKEFLAEDGLFCGTDPEEFWTTKDILKIYSEMFRAEGFEINFKIDKREIRVSPDGNSVIVVEQLIAYWISKKIPARTISHIIKTGETWKCDFQSYSMIPKNEDIDKLNKALE